MLQGDEDQLFDLIEYFHGHVSEGLEDDERSSFHGFRVAAGTSGPLTQHRPKPCSGSA